MVSHRRLPGNPTVAEAALGPLFLVGPVVQVTVSASRGPRTGPPHWEPQLPGHLVYRGDANHPANRGNSGPYWKTFVQERLATAVGHKGSLTLFGHQGLKHQLLAQHTADSEFWVRTEGHGRVVYEWKSKPNAPDNHWFDCLVGCTVAASMLGCKLAGHKAASRQRKRVKLSELQQKARATR